MHITSICREDLPITLQQFTKDTANLAQSFGKLSLQLYGINWETLISICHHQLYFRHCPSRNFLNFLHNKPNTLTCVTLYTISIIHIFIYTLWIDSVLRLYIRYRKMKKVPDRECTVYVYEVYPPNKIIILVVVYSCISFIQESRSVYVWPMKTNESKNNSNHLQIMSRLNNLNVLYQVPGFTC